MLPWTEQGMQQTCLRWAVDEPVQAQARGLVFGGTAEL